jgi:hypothetical protein
VFVLIACEFVDEYSISFVNEAVVHGINE